MTSSDGGSPRPAMSQSSDTPSTAERAEAVAVLGATLRPDSMSAVWPGARRASASSARAEISAARRRRRNRLANMITYVSDART